MENAASPFVFTKILHLGAMLTDECDICEPLTDFIENDLDEALVGDLKDQLDLTRVLKEFEDGEDKESALGEMAWCCKDQGRWGFLAYVEAPEVRKLPSGTKMVSRGICHCRWFYGEEFMEIIQAADAWAKSQETEGPMPKFVDMSEVEEDDDL